MATDYHFLEIFAPGGSIYVLRSIRWDNDPDIWGFDDYENAFTYSQVHDLVARGKARYYG